jgi:hypothetical protein
MRKELLTVLAVSSLALGFAGSPALAQGTIRVRGTIEKVEGNALMVKSRDGRELKVVPTDNALMVAIVKASTADIKQGSFVGVTGMPQADGSQRAIEVHIFPEAMRGTGEGHYAWDLRPQSTMTNANVEHAVCLISCSHCSPEGGCGAWMGRHGAMNPAGRARGCVNMSHSGAFGCVAPPWGQFGRRVWIDGSVSTGWRKPEGPSAWVASTGRSTFFSTTASNFRAAILSDRPQVFAFPDLWHSGAQRAPLRYGRPRLASSTYTIL